MTPQPVVDLVRPGTVTVAPEQDPDGTVTILTTADGRYLRVDVRFCELTGYSDAELRSGPAAATSHPDDVAADLAGLADLWSGRIDRHALDRRYVHRDGRVVWAATTATLVRDLDGAPAHAVVQVREIPGRRLPPDPPVDGDRRLRESQLMGGLGSWEIDLTTDRITRSDALLHILGMSAGDDVRHYADTRADVVHPDDRDAVRDAMRALLVHGVPMRMRYRIVRPRDGDRRWIDARGERFDLHGAPVRAAGTVVDVTELVLAEEVRVSQDAALRIARNQDALLATLVQGVIVIGVDGVVRTINEAAAAIGGLRTEQVAGQLGLGAWWGAVDQDGTTVPAADLPATRALREAVPVRQTIGIRCPDGDLSWQDVTAVPILDATGRPEYVVVGLSDVTEARRAKQALSVSEQRFRLAFDNAPVGMAMIDLSASTPGRLRRVNAALCAFTGRTRDELETLALTDISHPDEEPGWRGTMTALRTGQGVVAPTERRFVRADGTVVHGQVGLSYMPSEDAGAPYGVCLIEDVTARRAAEAALLHQSLHDPLTGLSNRHLFYDRAAHALAAGRRSGHALGLLYIDLDGFKAVNDTSGHAAGDELLVLVADRLRRSARPGDTVARLGGDEFAVICVDVPDLAALVAVGERVLAALCTPFLLSTATHRISGSIGAHLSTGSTDPDQLLAVADAAMYRAKAAGRNRIDAAVTT